MRPRLLDLFCGAGGAAMGYHRAGFDVVGVDIHDQPDYPFEFEQADALGVLRQDYDFQQRGSGWRLEDFDAIHASPPCQAYSNLKVMPTAKQDHPKLLVPTIDLLRSVDIPWVVENVGGARRDFPTDIYRFQLCGTSFGLRLYRHRWFASNVFVPALHCQHAAVEDVVGVYGSSDGIHEPGFKHPGTRRGPRQATTEEAREVMRMPWVTKRKGLTDAIPPAYTEHIGGYLMAEISSRQEAA
jgi:DNA (cytosine-5)-methyltransferase 1